MYILNKNNVIDIMIDIMNTFFILRVVLYGIILRIMINFVKKSMESQISMAKGHGGTMGVKYTMPKDQLQACFYQTYNYGALFNSK